MDNFPADTPIHLRPATAQDVHAIRRLVYAARINPSGLDWQRFIVASPEDAPDNVIGCAQIKPHRDGTKELASIVVAPEWRGMGAARALIEFQLAMHPGQLYLTCRGTLQAFYEKFGFHVIQYSQLPPYFRRVKHVFNLLRRLHLISDDLAIMVRNTIS